PILQQWTAWIRRNSEHRTHSSVTCCRGVYVEMSIAPVPGACYVLYSYMVDIRISGSPTDLPSREDPIVPSVPSFCHETNVINAKSSRAAVSSCEMRPRDPGAALLYTVHTYASHVTRRKGGKRRRIDTTRAYKGQIL